MKQVLPPLRKEEYEALKTDISKRGVLVPVEVDTATGAILDGHHRFAACWQLGLDPPEVRDVTLKDFSPAEYALAVNLIRRQMGPITWAKAFETLAEVRGIRLGEGGDRKSPVAEAGDSADGLATELGVAPRTARRRRQLAADLLDEPDLAAKVDTGEMAAETARRSARLRKPPDEEEGIPVIPPTVDLRCGDFREVLNDLESGSVDLILTDPPYAKEYLPLWPELAKVAARILRPNALLISYSGQAYLPEVMKGLGEHLEYVWLGALFLYGQHARMFDRHVFNTVKSLLFYARNPYEPGPWFQDSYRSEGPAKERHDWEQSMGAVRHYIEQLTRPGDLVVDPFLGSGTTAKAAYDLGRKFIGCDVDEAAVRVAGKRFD